MKFISKVSRHFLYWLVNCSVVILHSNDVNDLWEIKQSREEETIELRGKEKQI